MSVFSGFGCAAGLGKGSSRLGFSGKGEQQMQQTGFQGEGKRESGF